MESKAACQRILFVGVGGMGMTPLAVLLAKSGVVVDGIDDQLEEANQTILEAHYVGLTGTFDLTPGYQQIVYSRAIRHDDPRLEEARRKGISVVSRGEKLADFVANKQLIAVVGSHGKTTTTAMLIHLLRKHDVAFSYMLGGLFSDSSIAPADYQEGAEYMVAEVDESDGTIDLFAPAITVCQAVSWDHNAFYQSEASLHDTFTRLFSRTSEQIIYDEQVEELIDREQSPSHLTPLATHHFSCRAHHSDRTLLEVQSSEYLTGTAIVKAVGAYNAKNAILAMLAARRLIKKDLSEGLMDFAGVYRRQELLYGDRVEDFFVYQDYAHHPKEVSTFLESMRVHFPSYRRVVVFQPHRYSRTATFAREFADILSAEEDACLLPVYAASEEFIEAGSAQAVLAYARDRLKYFTDEQALYSYLDERAESKTVFLFIGAGDILYQANGYADRLRHFRSTGEECWLEDVARSKNFSGRTSYHEPLANKVTFRLGGAARFYAEPEDEDSLSILWKAASQANVSVSVIGRGSNLLVPDDEYEGLVIRLRSKFWRTYQLQEDGKIFARAGVGLRELCLFAVKQSYQDFAFMEGIPGSVGGAVRMNAGAMDGWMSQLIESVTFLTGEGEVVTKSVDELEFSYRKCEALRDGCVLSVVLASKSQANPETIKSEILEYSNKRKSSQPSEPSAGCMFKNPEHSQSGKLIDEGGLKGRTVGGIAISEIHGNFFVNKGNASFHDVVTLVKETRQEIFDKEEVWLEPEVQLLGKTWKELLDE